MISIDTNILFHSWYEPSPHHAAAYDWVRNLSGSSEVAVSEFVLAEWYRLLRNPVVTRPKPLSARKATDVIEAYRNHPRWRCIGFSADTRSLHDRLWKKAAQHAFPYRRLYDVRTALTMIDQGVTDLATTNVSDFEGLGFNKVWNPLQEPA
jgi:predicted nucleic acid-binding protein